MRVFVFLILLAAAGLTAWILAEGGDAPERGDRLATAPDTEPLPPKEKPDGPAEPAEKAMNLEGVLLDEEEQPVEGGRVTARGFDRTRWEWTEAVGEARSDHEGRFRLRVDDESWVRLRAQHPRYQLAYAYASARSDEPAKLILKRGAEVSAIVQDPDLQPVAGAKVRLFDRDEGEYLDEVVTDAQGRVLAGVVAPGRVLVTVDHPGFAVRKSDHEIADLDPVELTLRLDRGGVLEGRVLSPGGEPVADARVHPSDDNARVATTDEAGRYRLEAIGGEDVRITAEADGFGPGYFGSLLGWGRAVPVEVGVGETVRGIDIALSPASFVRGRVVDADGAGIEGLQVRVSGRYIIGQGGGSAATDAEGKFEIGPFGLREPSRLQIALLSGEHTIHVPELEPLEPGGDLDVGTLEATRRSMVRGRVVTEQGEPITGGGTVIADGYRAHCQIRPDGTFELAGLGAGEHELQARAGEEPELISKMRKLTVEGGRDVEDVVLVVQPTFVVSGVVLTNKGTPRSGKRVIVVPEGTEQPIPWANATVMSTGSNGRFKAPALLEGRYVVGLVNWGNNGWVLEDDPEPQIVEAGTTGVELRVAIKGGLVRGVVRSKATGQPVGKFEVNRYRYKLVFPDYEGRDDFEDPAGLFQLEVEQPGRWAFEVSAPGFAPLRTSIVTVKSGEETDLGEIRLGQAGGIHGRVTDHRGQGVGWARIHLLNAKLQTNWAPPWTRPSGRYELKGIAPGTYNLFAVSPRHPLAMIRNVVVEEAVSTRVDVEFKGSAPLTIRVLDEKGQPLPGAELIWTFPELRPLNSRMAGAYEPPGYGSNVADERGVIRKPYLPAGPVDLEIGAKGYRPRKRTVELNVGEAKEIEIRLDLER